MCVCVFPDFPGVTSEWLLYLSNFKKLRVLIIHGVPASFISGRDGQKDPGSWIRGLPAAVTLLVVRGELRGHIHTVHGGLIGIFPPPDSAEVGKSVSGLKPTGLWGRNLFDSSYSLGHIHGVVRTHPSARLIYLLIRR